MKRLKLESLKTVLCVGAHCDDIEIGCGGTLLTLLSRHKGVSVHWLVLTSTPERRDEAAAGADRFLADAASREVEILDHRDGYLPYSGRDVKDTFEDLKKRVAPDIVFTHYRHDLHQDHRLACELTWNTYRDHLILEYEIPKWDGDLGNPNLFVPLEAETATKKASDVVSCFASQRQKHWFTEDTFLSVMRLRGIEGNAPSGYAEAFHSRKLSL